ncbi:MAG: hypothetical protein Q8L54_00625 [Devosia sp.]|nr:hypothetical protein [Devosia sp.]
MLPGSGCQIIVTHLSAPAEILKIAFPRVDNRSQARLCLMKLARMHGLRELLLAEDILKLGGTGKRA